LVNTFFRSNTTIYPDLKSLYYILAFVLITLFPGCSSERNTWTSKAYHNTTSHYNGYYYAREELKKIEKTIWESMQDDHNRILRLYPTVDSSLAKSYDKEIQEAIKMASIAIQRHPNSKWVDDCYILVGIARLYSLDWGNAIQSFKYVNTKSKDPDARHRAIISLIRTFTEHLEYNNAQAAIDYLQKEPLNKTNKKNLLLEKAYFYQQQGNYDYMVRNLAQAEDYLKKKDRPGRVFFIVGQVYQKLGFESEAYHFYKKCLATNPDYEIDFYARLYMAQVTQISRSRNVVTARKSFKKMLKDSKNREFRDKIYYEMGVFELKQKNINDAITEFNRSVRVGKNKQIDGEAYLRLGEIYYDTLKKYQLSQKYYDSAINSLSHDYEGYEQIKARAEILNEFVKHLNTISWQDSLLSMTSIDSITLRQRIDSAFASKKAKDDKGGKKKRNGNRVQISAQNDAFFTSDEEGNPLVATDQSGDWYFSNQSAMAIGQNEFKRVWGDIALQDNWRRSSRSTTAANRLQTPVDNPTETVQENAPEAAAPVDPVVAEFNRITAEIPRTDEKRKEALGKIEEAYFQVGDIYNFKLLEPENAVTYYQKLLTRFPDSQYEPEVLYRLYLLYKEKDPAQSAAFAERLKTEHPESTLARILINPNYLAESQQALERQKEIYKTAYDYFRNGQFSASLKAIDEAMAIGENSFTPQVELLKILIVGKTEDISQYQFQLDNFTKKYPATPVGEYAKTLLNASRDWQKSQDKSQGIQYIKSLEEPHYFAIVYKKSENMGNLVTTTLERFNKEYFRDLGLRTSNLLLNDEYIITLVADLPRVSSAIEYVRTFNEKLPGMSELRNHKFHNFVITKDNFDIFYRTKGLDEYIFFFEKNYPQESQ
jgi:tetratricopeptide (TPR) repeat protein